MHLRVNADDLGLTPRVNDESFDLISRGLVDSASIIANAPEAEDAIQRTSQAPRCSFGVHLNASEFQPLRPAAALAPLLDSDGSFTNVLWRVRKDHSLRRAIYQEWSAQIERCLELGFRPSHIDSHYDVHLLPDFLAIVCRLQSRFGIRRVRRRTRIPAASRQLRRAVRDGIWTTVLAARGSELTHYRCGLREFWTAIEGGTRLAGLFENHSLELVVHPGNDLDPMFREETELLRAGWLGRVKEREFGTCVPAIRSVQGCSQVAFPFATDDRRCCRRD